MPEMPQQELHLLLPLLLLLLGLAVVGLQFSLTAVVQPETLHVLLVLQSLRQFLGQQERAPALLLVSAEHTFAPC